MAWKTGFQLLNQEDHWADCGGGGAYSVRGDFSEIRTSLLKALSGSPPREAGPMHSPPRRVSRATGIPQDRAGGAKKPA